MRITNASTAYYALLPLLKSQSVLRAEKIIIYKTLMRPESRTLNKNIAKWLAASQRKVLSE
jgi:hypothetical protein